MNYKRKSRRCFFLLTWSRTAPISSWIPLWNSNGADSQFCHYAYVTSCLGEKKNTTVGGHSWRGGLFTKQLKKWVKAVFLLGCYGCIFHGTGNLAQLCQNFGIFFWGGGWTPQTPPWYATERYCIVFYVMHTYSSWGIDMPLCLHLTMYFLLHIG